MIACAPAPAAVVPAGSASTSPSSPPVASGPPAWQFTDVSFQSRLEDKVGPSNVMPNGKPDLKMRMVLTSTKPVTIRAIDVRQLGQNIPAVSYPVQWSTADADHWVLGVFAASDTVLNTAHAPSLTRLDGTLNLNLYGEGYGSDGVPLTAGGTEFEVRVTDSDGNAQTRTFKAM
jgi:hypothetical protein